MQKSATFGNAALAEKMVSRFGEAKESVKVEMKYAADVQSFVTKVATAHREAAKSKLVFG